MKFKDKNKTKKSDENALALQIIEQSNEIQIEQVEDQDTDTPKPVEISTEKTVKIKVSKRKFNRREKHSEQIEETLRLSKLCAKGTLLRRLSYEHDEFIPVNLDIQDEEVKFSYSIIDCKPLGAISEESRADQFRLLSNIENLRKLSYQYEFSLDPSNLFYNYNLQVKILKRDLHNKHKEHAQKDFLLQYKCLCAHVLNKRFDFLTYLNGGSDLFSKKKILAQIYDMTDSRQVSEMMMDLFVKEKTNIEKTKILCDKKRNRTKTISLILISVIAAGGIAYSVNYFFFTKPYNAAVVAANNDYLAVDYNGVIDNLTRIETTGLSKESRYILAVSFINTASMPLPLRNSILNDLSLKSDDELINFWIELGRLNFPAAKDIALRINDDKLTYLYLVYERAYTAADKTMAGAAKEAKLAELDASIQELQDEFDKEMELLLKAEEEAAAAAANAEGAPAEDIVE